MSASFADWIPPDHRDETAYPLANKFAPLSLHIRPQDDQFNHFSNGKQSCAGRNLALMLAKGLIATLLSQGSYRLARPRLNPASLCQKCSTTSEFVL